MTVKEFEASLLLLGFAYIDNECANPYWPRKYEQKVSKHWLTVFVRGASQDLRNIVCYQPIGHRAGDLKNQKKENELRGVLKQIISDMEKANDSARV